MIRGWGTDTDKGRSLLEDPSPPGTDQDKAWISFGGKYTPRRNSPWPEWRAVDDVSLHELAKFYGAGVRKRNESAP